MAGVMEVLAVELAPLEAHEQERRERLAKDRERKFRGKVQGSSAEIPRKANGNSTEVPRNASRVEDNYNFPTLVDTSRKTIPPNPPLPSRALDPDGFEAFWDAYPKRDGSADRKGAVKAFKAALRRETLETILDGVEHFAEAMTARGKVGTEYIPQARTWLNSDRWSERYDAATIADSKHAQNLAILEKYRAAPRS
jgi:hypothetical protein